MSNPFELRITLRQHTPIIHFQHHQDWATLRASEVKPKLDRFLIEQMGKLHPIDKKSAYDAGAIYAKAQRWLIGEGDNGNALDYKMRVITIAEPKSDLIHKGQSFPCFFANMGDEYDLCPKKFVLHAEPIKLYITCFDTDLKNFIDTHFHSFIAQTNFGMRQSKGFGSFSVDGQPFSNAVACFTVGKDNQNNCRALFDAIDIFYKSLRGGVRTYGRDGSEFYFKSLLVTYYHNFNPTPTLDWDKKAIKQFLENGKTRVNGTDIKDALGFSTTEEWKKWHVSITKKDKRKDEIDTLERQILNERNTVEKGKLILKKDEISDALVARFASPIVFKPIYNGQNWIIYIFLQNIPKAYKDTTILAKVRNETVSLKMWDDFDLEDFLNSIENYNDEDAFDEHVRHYYDPIKTRKSVDDFLQHSDCIRLRRIFSTFKLL